MADLQISQNQGSSLKTGKRMERNGLQKSGFKKQLILLGFPQQSES